MKKIAIKNKFIIILGLLVVFAVAPAANVSAQTTDNSLISALQSQVEALVQKVAQAQDLLWAKLTGNTPVMTAALNTATTTGSGAPSGTHYNLNIIGVPKDKTADMTGDNGRRIFVPLERTSKIYLQQGTTFLVLDANGTDGNGAKFQLPNPDPDNDGITVYSVYARALGKPGGKAVMTTCATDPLTMEEVCSLNAYIAVRGKGKSTFTNVSRELLYIYADLTGDGVIERMPLFDDDLQDYFWNYDNQGLKLLQLRFYPISSNVN